MSDNLKFWASVIKTDFCWLWCGDLTEKGYGRFYVGGTKHRAHRYAYETEVGRIPAGLVIDHTCHTPACVRPSHLRPVTHKQNCENRKGAQRNSKSGVRGVVWEKRRGKWRVSCSHAGKEYHGGYFLEFEAAKKAAADLRNSLFTHNDADRVAK